jgi:hypothetical protein
LRKWVTEAETISGQLELATRKWSAQGNRVQVKLRPGQVHAFAWTAEGRKRFESGSPEILENHELTHSALSRAVILDQLLPVLGHVLGPAEMRYFAQLPEVFLAQTGGLPLLCPRMRAMGLSSEGATLLESHGFSRDAWPTLTPSKLRLAALKIYREQDVRRPDHPGEARDRFIEAIRVAFGNRGGDERALPSFEKGIDRGLAKLFRGVERNWATPDRKVRAALRWLGEGREQDRHLNVFSLMSALGGEAQLKKYQEALNPLEPSMQGGVYGEEA